MSNEGRNKKTLLIFFSVISLWLGFYQNLWLAAENAFFYTHQRDADAHILGRIMKSRRDGLFSSGGLLGVVGPSPKGMPLHLHQFDAYYSYNKNYEFESFSEYRSMIGLQGMMYGLFDKMTSLGERNQVNFFRFINSMFFSIVLSIIIFWIYLQFGFVSGLTVLISCLLSQWLTVFGRNLWWVMWAFYLPFVASLYAITRCSHKRGKEVLIIYTAVFFKCLFNGYEYITTTTLMMLTPYVYYGIKEKWGVVESIKRIFVVSFAAVISVLTTTLILAFQISMVTGSYLSGLHHIFIHSVGRRTHGSSSDFPLAFSESLNAGTVEVLEKYLKGTVIDFNTVFCTSCYFENTFSSLKMTYSCVIILLILSSILIVISRYYFSEGILYEILGKDARVFALLVAAWFSLAAPMSWFTIFKAHSYQHLHMNYIAWHMPFTLLSFAAFGKIAQCFVHRLWQINRKWYLT